MKKEDLIKIALKRYHNNSATEFTSWFNDLSAKQKKILFKDKIHPSYRYLTNINYLPDGYYLIKQENKKNIIEVKDNAVYEFYFNGTRTVLDFFKNKTAPQIADRFTIWELEDKLRMVFR
jgi:hypothetical protein